jgi:mannose-6-phosphate isomerase-like protein (cupin superfamily)
MVRSESSRSHFLGQVVEGLAVRIERTDPEITKGWYWGPWNSNLDISVGFANKGVDEPHVHTRMTEIYLIARGTAEMRVETEAIDLSQGQVIVVEPGEAHTFLSCSPDHFHYVLQVPGLEGEEARVDKVLVPRSRLGL